MHKKLKKDEVRLLTTTAKQTLKPGTFFYNCYPKQRPDFEQESQKIVEKMMACAKVLNKKNPGLVAVSDIFLSLDFEDEEKLDFECLDTMSDVWQTNLLLARVADILRRQEKFNFISLTPENFFLLSKYWGASLCFTCKEMKTKEDHIAYNESYNRSSEKYKKDFNLAELEPSVGVLIFRSAKEKPRTNLLKNYFAYAYLDGFDKRIVKFICE